MSQPNIIVAVRTLRSYRKALDGNISDPNSIRDWISRHAENQNRLREFPQDAAIGMLCHLGNPIYSYSNLNSEQQAWSGIFSSAEQALNQETSWQNTQSAQHNATTFVRLFSGDVQWIQSYMQSMNIPLDTPFEYFVNFAISSLRTAEGQAGAGGINHRTFPLPGSQSGNLP